MTEDQTPNPFDALGGGGFDMNALLQQAQQMQQQVMDAQAQLAETTVDGTVADGLVTVTVNGTGDLVGVKIRRGSFDPDDTEDLEDLIVAAYRDARARADAMAAQALDPLAAGLDLENPGFGQLGDASGGPSEGGAVEGGVVEGGPSVGGGPGQGKPSLGF